MEYPSSVFAQVLMCCLVPTTPCRSQIRSLRRRRSWLMKIMQMQFLHTLLTRRGTDRNCIRGKIAGALTDTHQVVSVRWCQWVRSGAKFALHSYGGIHDWWGAHSPFRKLHWQIGIQDDGICFWCHVCVWMRLRLNFCLAISPANGLALKTTALVDIHFQRSWLITAHDLSPP